MYQKAENIIKIAKAFNAGLMHEKFYLDRSGKMWISNVESSYLTCAFENNYRSAYTRPVTFSTGYCIVYCVDNGDYISYVDKNGTIQILTPEMFPDFEYPIQEESFFQYCCLHEEEKVFAFHLYDLCKRNLSAGFYFDTKFYDECLEVLENLNVHL